MAVDAKEVVVIPGHEVNFLVSWDVQNLNWREDKRDLSWFSRIVEAQMPNRSTHGGGVVFKMTSDGPRYLLVEASGTRGRYLFPKGHVEDGETPAIAALREVSEEAGVRARPIRRLRRVEQKKEGDWISVVYFLMAYAGRAKPLEDRRVRWLSFDEAIEELDLGKSRRVLRSADRLISLATGEEPRRHRFGRAASHVAEWLALGALVV